MTAPVRVLFVCLGNICRSPTAEGVFRARVEAVGLRDRFLIDSAGTGDWHLGHLPDPRTREVAEARGFRLEHRARQVKPADLDAFDVVVAMDEANHRDLMAMALSAEAQAKVRLFLEFHPLEPRRAAVPDPYLGTRADFEHVFDLCDEAALGLLRELCAQQGWALPP
jgi:protein-tyrosine phosphatase